jgi:hypothetical protein
MKPVGPAAPRTASSLGANPMRLAGDMAERFALLPGWPAFLLDAAPRMQLSATPGWENGTEAAVQTEAGPVAMPHLTKPGAKAIGAAQWGVAIMLAGLFAEAVLAAGLPYVDPDPAGFLVLTWAFGAANGVSLTLRASLLGQQYEWVQMLEGTPRTFAAADPAEFISSLRTVAHSVLTHAPRGVVGKRKAADE